MTSNQGHPEELRLDMHENRTGQSDFIRKQMEKLKSAENQGTASSRRVRPLIQRVPPVLYGIKADFKKYFEPRLVALGPLHHGNPKFERAEQSKLKFADRFAGENYNNAKNPFDKIMAEIEDLKKCYNPEDIRNYDDEKLAWMLFVDGCAVLHAIHYGMQGKFETLGTKPDLMVFAQLDLFLLENQLPYRVLEILIGSATHRQQLELSITNFIARNLITNITGEQKSQPAEGRDDKKDYVHLLERLRTQLLKGKEEKSSSSKIGGMLLSCGDSRKHRKTFRSIKELKESGIHVKPSKTNNIKNIYFYCNFLGNLMMPRLLVDDSTVSKFMNLVALEMCRDFDNDLAITTYLWFLDSLIDTADDVKELRVTGMLHNYLGSDEEVANLFNRMSRDLVADQAIYQDVIENIHKYCNNPWTTAVAYVYYNYFSSPWTFLAFLGAIIGLLLSAIQAYFSLPHHRNKF